MSVEQIQGLVDGLAGRLGRAVVVDDRELRLVAASADFGDADPARVWSLLNRRTRPEDVRLEEIARLTEPGYVPENPALELWQRLCVPIRHRGMLVGFAWITDRFGDLTVEQVAEAGRAAQEIGVLLHARLVTGERERARRQELVEQLLSPDAAVRSAARDEVVDRGLLDDGGPAAVVLIRHGPEDGGPADVERFLRDQPGVRALAAYWPRRTTVIVTGRARPGADGLDGLIGRLLTEADTGQIGVGGPVRGLGELPAARRQADIALAVATAGAGGAVGDGGAAGGDGGAAGSGVGGGGAHGGATRWTELSADALLAQFPRQAWADALLPEGVARLLADPAAAALLPTLEAFLDCAGDVGRTAAGLRVHRSTLYHRLSRAEQLSGLSLRDGRDRLLIHLALRLHRLYGTPPRPALPADDPALSTDDGESGRNPQQRAG